MAARNRCGSPPPASPTCTSARTACRAPSPPTEPFSRLAEEALPASAASAFLLVVDSRPCRGALHYRKKGERGMARTLDRQFLRTLTPLDSLKPEHQVELGKKSPVQTLGAGRYLFREGDKDNRTLYVISGEVELRKGDEVVRVVAAGTPEATRPLAQQTPRPCSARARSDIEFIAIDSDLLDIMLTWHQTGSFEVGELHAGEDTGDDWMAVILQTRAFHRIPPANIQAMFLRMQPVQ